MAYELTATDQPLNIKEQEWGVGAEIKFSRFTSCIGIIAMLADKKNLIGIHLVMIDNNSNPFSKGDVAQVLGVLEKQNAVLKAVQVVGQTQMWADQLSEAFDYLLSNLNHPTLMARDDGDFSASVNNGKIDVKYAPQQK